MTDALLYLKRKGKSNADIARDLDYIRAKNECLNYSHVADAGYPIGSGAVESGNRMLTTFRLKRSGQRWGA